FHGNAQNLSAHFHIMAWLTEHDYDVFVFDYRGYGLSVGTPSPKLVHQDALAALELSTQYLTKEKYPKWIIHGQSLGGIIAMRALEDFKQHEKINLLVLDCTFDSYDDIAFDKLTDHWLTFLFSPLAYVLISDAMAPHKFFNDFNRPVLVMHGSEDHIIPSKFGRRIFERLKHDNKFWWSIENSQHIDAFHAENAKQAKLLYLDYLTKN